MHSCECKKIHTLPCRRIPEQKNPKPNVLEQKGHRFIEFHSQALQERVEDESYCFNCSRQRSIRNTCIKHHSRDKRSCFTTTSICSTKSCCSAACEAVYAINLPPCPIIEPPSPIHETNLTNLTYPIYHNSLEMSKIDYADTEKSHGKDVNISLQSKMPSSKKNSTNCSCRRLMVLCQGNAKKYKKSKKRAEDESTECLLEIIKRNIEASTPILMCNRPPANTRKSPYESKLNFVDKVKEIIRDGSEKEHIICEVIKYKALYKCPFQRETQVAYFIPCIKKTNTNDVGTTVNTICHWSITENKKQTGGANKKHRQGNCEAKKRIFGHERYHKKYGQHGPENRHVYKRYHEQDHCNLEYQHQYHLIGEHPNEHKHRYYGHKCQLKHANHLDRYYDYYGHEKHLRTHSMEYDYHQPGHHSSSNHSRGRSVDEHVHRLKSGSETCNVVYEHHHFTELDHEGRPNAEEHAYRHLKSGIGNNMIGRKEHYDFHNKNHGSRHKNAAKKLIVAVQ